MKLVISSSIDVKYMKKLEASLRQIPNLRLVLFGGSVEDGVQVVVKAEEPIRLIKLLREMPLVEEVVAKGKEIQIALKTKQ